MVWYLLWTHCKVIGKESKPFKTGHWGFVPFPIDTCLHSACRVLPISLRARLDLFILMFKKVQRANPVRYHSPDPVSGVITRLRSAPTLPINVPSSQRFRNSVTYCDPMIWETLIPSSRQITNLVEFKKIMKTKILIEFSELQYI